MALSPPRDQVSSLLASSQPKVVVTPPVVWEIRRPRVSLAHVVATRPVAEEVSRSLPSTESAVCAPPVTAPHVRLSPLGLMKAPSLGIP